MRTVVIVDDSESMRDLVSLTLKTAGYSVLEGVDGLDALKYFNGTKIHLVITDLNMPEMNGISLIKAIRKIPDYEYTPIILLTTESNISKKEEAKAAGATGWVVKPFHQERLLEVVKKLIR